MVIIISSHNNLHTRIKKGKILHQNDLVKSEEKEETKPSWFDNPKESADYSSHSVVKKQQESKPIEKIPKQTL